MVPVCFMDILIMVIMDRVVTKKGIAFFILKMKIVTGNFKNSEWLMK